MITKAKRHVPKEVVAIIAGKALNKVRIVACEGLVCTAAQQLEGSAEVVKLQGLELRVALWLILEAGHDNRITCIEQSRHQDGLVMVAGNRLTV